MKRLLFILVILSVACSVKASDTIIIRKDPRLDVLTAKQAAFNKRSSMMTANGQYKGFRLQVVSTTNRDQANKVKSDLLNKYPEEKAYITFQSPYFKVRIGNFIKKEDADKFRKMLGNQFPQGVFVVEDAIEYTPPAEEDITAP
jgi:RNA recognition motif-containing protein